MGQVGVFSYGFLALLRSMVLNPVSLINYLVLGIRVYLMRRCESRLGCFIAFELNLIRSIVLLH